VSNEEFLPGFERLRSVLKSRGQLVDCLPIPPAPFQVPQVVLDAPLDPMLIALYSRCNGGFFGDLLIFRLANDEGSLVGTNVLAREIRGGVRHSTFRFAKVQGLPNYLATVPSLGHVGEVQPVVMSCNDMADNVFPVASSVDRCLDLYATHCEERLVQFGALDAEPALDQDSLLFPYSYVEQIARDAVLVKMLNEHRFDALIAHTEEGQEWVRQVLAAARRLH